MRQINETPAVGAVRGSEMHIAAGSSDTSRYLLTPNTRQGFHVDLRIVRLRLGNGSADLVRSGRRP